MTDAVQGTAGDEDSTKGVATDTRMYGTKTCQQAHKPANTATGSCGLFAWMGIACPREASGAQLLPCRAFTRHQQSRRSPTCSRGSKGLLASKGDILRIHIEKTRK